tara:strand:- start:51 stop:332 length:282 start_codon:yes stop_codon:yes gene_type:complete
MKQNQRKIGKFKQGQTVYAIHVDITDGEFIPRMKRYFLYSHKSKLPKQGEIIKRMNESYLNWITSKLNSFIVTTSRRKALRMLNNERRKWKGL